LPAGVPARSHDYPAAEGGFLTAQEVAQLLHLQVKRVQTLARGGALPAVRIGRKWLFPHKHLLAMLRMPRGTEGTTYEEVDVEISARNQLRGRVTAISVGGVMAEVRVMVGGQELVSVITRASSERMGIKVGDEVVTIIKATEVMLGKP
jgi:molybdopterin-binding protein